MGFKSRCKYVADLYVDSNRDSTTMQIFFLHYEYIVLVWFGLILNIQVNSYGHVEAVSSPSHTLEIT